MIYIRKDYTQKNNKIKTDQPFTKSLNNKRQTELKNLFNITLVNLIKNIAQKYQTPEKQPLDPKMIAAIILAEQRNMFYLENITDIISAPFNNPSVGLAQIRISIARTLFPEKLKGKTKLEIALILSQNTAFNVECCAKLLADILRQYRLKYPNEPYDIRKIGSKYTSHSFLNIYPWGNNVEICYQDILESGLFVV